MEGDNSSITCEGCGHNVPSSNITIHRARCQSRQQQQQQQQQQQEQQQQQNYSRDDTIICQEESVEIINGEASNENLRGVSAETNSNHHHPSQQEEATTEQQQDQWACPRCTLLNPETMRICEACLYNNNQSNRTRLTVRDDPSIGWSVISGQQRHQHDQQRQQRFMIRFQEPNPLISHNVIGSASTIATWSLFGGLVGGPVGSILAGGTAAVVDGAMRLQSHLQSNNPNHHDEHRRQQQQRPRMLFSSTRRNGSSLTITNNASGRFRSMQIQPILMTTPPAESSDGGPGDGNNNNNGQRDDFVNDETYWSQLTPADQRILQMLFLHALADSTIRDDEVLFLTRDELLERFGYVPSQTRGASKESIEQNSKLTVLEDTETIVQLNDNQKCCNICLEDFKVGDEMRKLTSCSHTYHKACIDRWLSQVASCPTCKKEIS